MPIPELATRMREKERVLPFAEDQRQATGHREDQVEDREDVGADDALVRATVLLLRRGTMLGAPPLGLGVGQSP